MNKKIKKKIKKLIIENFKCFGNRIEIDLKCKSIIIYGENGSGKTSIIEALKLLFDSAVIRKMRSEQQLKQQRNIFNGSNKEINIIIILEDNKEIKLASRPNDYDNDSKMFLHSLSQSATILSYKTLMKIYGLKTKEDFYNLFIKDIMSEYAIPPQYQQTIGDLLERLNKPKVRPKHKKIEEQIKHEVNKILSDIKDKWNKYIQRLLSDDKFNVDCKLEKIGELDFNIRWHERDLLPIFPYLNEARLNAIILSFYLAYHSKLPTPYKMLLLDDPLIGLDMNLRIPLLYILKEDFKDYQIIITTFDEQWFKLMKTYLSGDKYEFIELKVIRTDSPIIPFTICVQQSDYLTKAESYLNNNDIIAAAYARLEFERIVKKYCEKKKLRIRYNVDKIDEL